MAAVLVPVILILIVAVLVALAVRAFTRREVEHSDELQQRPSRYSVRYQVPPGQDPAAVLHHLESEGYDVSPDSERGPSSPILVIGTHEASVVDREYLRRTLASFDETNVNPEESGHLDRPPVRVLDEQDA
jgi:hypothetical protein